MPLSRYVLKASVVGYRAGQRAVALTAAAPNPSSRYAAEGTAGLINIVLKKERQDGWNGQANATRRHRRQVQHRAEPELLPEQGERVRLLRFPAGPAHGLWLGAPDRYAAGPGFEAQSRNKRESRIVYLGFTYRFGNAGDPARNKRRDEQPDDGGGRGFE